MRRGREKRLLRLTAAFHDAAEAARQQRKAAEFRGALIAAVRYSLIQLGVDPSTVAAIRRHDAETVAPPDPRPPPPPRRYGLLSDPRIEAMTQRYRDGDTIDFAQASLVQVLAWCIGRTAAKAASDAGGP